jgi:hypothetical protein
LVNQGAAAAESWVGGVPSMDIFEQVAKLLRDIEARDKRDETDYQLAQAALMGKLYKQYSQYVKKGQWKRAHDCLVDILQLGAAMLFKPGST